MFNPGRQVAYIPMHANARVTHVDVEFGFVASDSDKEYVFVRYWKNPHEPKHPVLRTLADSEATPREHLTAYKSVNESFVRDAYEEYVSSDEDLLDLVEMEAIKGP